RTRVENRRRRRIRRRQDHPGARGQRNPSAQHRGDDDPGRSRGGQSPRNPQQVHDNRGLRLRPHHRRRHVRALPVRRPRPRALLVPVGPAVHRGARRSRPRRRPPTRRLLVLHRPAGGARHSLRRRPQQLRVLLRPGPDPRGTRPGPLSPPPGMRRPGTRVRQTGAGHPGPTCDDDHRGGGRPMNAQRGIPSSHQNAFRLYGPQFQNKPAELYRQMRTDYGPVAPVLLDGDIPAWLVIGYREVTHVLNRPETFARSSRRWNAWDLVPENWPLYPMVTRTPNILYSEGEEHRRRATAISDALSGADQHEVRQYAV